MTERAFVTVALLLVGAWLFMGGPGDGRQLMGFLVLTIGVVLAVVIAGFRFTRR